MTDRVWKLALLALVAALLLSQWLSQFMQYRQMAHQLALLQSIETSVKQQVETTDQMVASLEDLADVLDDVHGHVEGMGSE